MISDCGGRLIECKQVEFNITVRRREIRKLSERIADMIFSKKTLEDAKKMLEDSIKPDFIGGDRVVNKVTVKKVYNGYLVDAGCSEIVFSDPEQLIQEFASWIRDPEKAEEKYTGRAYEEVTVFDLGISSATEEEKKTE